MGFADALSAASQSLAPRALRRAKQRPRVVLSTVLRETGVAATVAFGLTWGLAACGGSLFSANPFVHATLAKLGPWIGASLGVYVLNTVFEGTLFAFGHEADWRADAVQRSGRGRRAALEERARNAGDV